MTGGRFMPLGLILLIILAVFLLGGFSGGIGAGGKSCHDYPGG